jgi:hypothetical protein
VRHRRVADVHTGVIHAANPDAGDVEVAVLLVAPGHLERARMTFTPLIVITVADVPDGVDALLAVMVDPPGGADPPLYRLRLRITVDLRLLGLEMQGLRAANDRVMQA